MSNLLCSLPDGELRGRPLGLHRHSRRMCGPSGAAQPLYQFQRQAGHNEAAEWLSKMFDPHHYLAGDNPSSGGRGDISAT